jgi:hypothetical protein
MSFHKHKFCNLQNSQSSLKTPSNMQEIAFQIPLAVMHLRYHIYTFGQLLSPFGHLLVIRDIAKPSTLGGVVMFWPTFPRILTKSKKMGKYHFHFDQLWPTFELLGGGGGGVTPPPYSNIPTCNVMTALLWEADCMQTGASLAGSHGPFQKGMGHFRKALTNIWFLKPIDCMYSSRGGHWPVLNGLIYYEQASCMPINARLSIYINCCCKNLQLYCIILIL